MSCTASGMPTYTSHFQFVLKFPLFQNPSLSKIFEAQNCVNEFPHHLGHTCKIQRAVEHNYGKSKRGKIQKKK